MLDPVPGDEVRGAAAGARARRAVTHRARERRMACEAQVVIAAEVDERAPVLRDEQPLFGGAKAADRQAPAPELRCVELRERRRERRHTAFARERLQGELQRTPAAALSVLRARRAAAAGAASAASPKRANSCWSRSTSGLPVVRSFSP